MVKLKLVPFDAASEANIQLAAKFAGVDEQDEKLVDFIEECPLSKEGRKALIKAMLAAGFQSVDETDADWIIPSKTAVKSGSSKVVQSKSTKEFVMAKKVKVVEGDRVQYKTGGKVSRLEGMAGKLVWGTVKEIREPAADGEGGRIVVLADYRNADIGKVKKDVHAGMRSVIEPGDVKSVEKADANETDVDESKPSKKPKKEGKDKSSKKPAKKAEKPAKGGKKPNKKSAGFEEGQNVSVDWDGKTYKAKVVKDTGTKVRVRFRGDDEGTTFLMTYDQVTAL